MVSLPPYQDYLFSEVAKNELQAFSTETQNPIAPSLEHLLEVICKVGITCYSWDHLKHLISKKMEQRLLEFIANSSDVNQQSFQETGQKIISYLQGFKSAPFTLQRLCELLVFPEKYYKSTKKYLFALERLLMVSSTQPTLLPDEYNTAVQELFAARQNIDDSNINSDKFQDTTIQLHSGSALFNSTSTDSFTRNESENYSESKENDYNGSKNDDHNEVTNINNNELYNNQEKHEQYERQYEEDSIEQNRDNGNESENGSSPSVDPSADNMEVDDGFSMQD